MPHLPHPQPDHKQDHPHRHPADDSGAATGSAPGSATPRRGHRVSPLASAAAGRLGKVVPALAALWIAVGWALEWWGS